MHSFSRKLVLSEKEDKTEILVYMKYPLWTSGITIVLEESQMQKFSRNTHIFLTQISFFFYGKVPLGSYIV